MADLNAAARRALPQSDFAGPGRSFPIPDANHARLAISGAARSANVGNISLSQKAHIDALARALLNK